MTDAELRDQAVAALKATTVAVTIDADPAFATVKNTGYYPISNVKVNGQVIS